MMTGTPGRPGITISKQSPAKAADANRGAERAVAGATARDLEHGRPILAVLVHQADDALADGLIGEGRGERAGIERVDRYDTEQ